jgi:hypothetical protein
MERVPKEHITDSLREPRHPFNRQHPLLYRSNAETGPNPMMIINDSAKSVQRYVGHRCCSCNPEYGSSTVEQDRGSGRQLTLHNTLVNNILYILERFYGSSPCFSSETSRFVDVRFAGCSSRHVRLVPAWRVRRASIFRMIAAAPRYTCTPVLLIVTHDTW